MKNKIPEPCARHNIIGCSFCMQECLEEILYRTIAGGNGGYYSNFGPVLLSKMLKLTGYDMKNREINKVIEQ